MFTRHFAHLAPGTTQFWNEPYIFNHGGVLLQDAYSTNDCFNSNMVYSALTELLILKDNSNPDSDGDIDEDSQIVYERLVQVIV